MREYQIKKDGYVYLVQEHDSHGLANTYYNLGKDPNSPRWHEEVEEMNSKKKKKNEDIKNKDEI